MSNPYREPANPTVEYKKESPQFVDVEVQDCTSTFHLNGVGPQVKFFKAEPQGWCYWGKNREKVLRKTNARDKANEYIDSAVEDGIFHFDSISVPVRKLVKVSHALTHRVVQVKMY